MSQFVYDTECGFLKAVDRRKVTSPVRDIDDEVIILKPIGPGIQTLEPDSTGTLKRPMTPLIPLSGRCPKFPKSVTITGFKGVNFT